MVDLSFLWKAYVSFEEPDSNLIQETKQACSPLSNIISDESLNVDTPKPSKPNEDANMIWCL